MACRSKRLAGFIFAALSLVLLPACTELGDLVIVKFTLTQGQVTLQELDQDFLPKKVYAPSSKCLVRVSQTGFRHTTGVCVDSDENSILVYRAFELKFKAKERGITEELLKSEGYGELKGIADGVEKYLQSKGLKYSRGQPYYQDYWAVHKKYELYR